MLLYFFTLQLLGYRIFRWLFNFTISWLFNFTKFWWYKVTYYNSSEWAMEFIRMGKQAATCEYALNTLCSCCPCRADTRNTRYINYLLKQKKDT